MKLEFACRALTTIYMAFILYWVIMGILETIWASQAVLVVKNPSASAGELRDRGSIPGSGRSPGKEHGNPLQYSCLESLMDRGAW